MSKQISQHCFCHIQSWKDERIILLNKVDMYAVISPVK